MRVVPLSPVVGQSDFARLGRRTTLLPRPSVDTGAGDRGGAPAEVAVVAGTVGCREDVGLVVLRRLSAVATITEFINPVDFCVMKFLATRRRNTFQCICVCVYYRSTYYLL